MHLPNYCFGLRSGVISRADNGAANSNSGNLNRNGAERTHDVDGSRAEPPGPRQARQPMIDRPQATSYSRGSFACKRWQVQEESFEKQQCEKECV